MPRCYGSAIRYWAQEVKRTSLFGTGSQPSGALNTGQGESVLYFGSQRPSGTGVPSGASVLYQVKTICLLVLQVMITRESNCAKSGPSACWCCGSRKSVLLPNQEPIGATGTEVRSDCATLLLGKEIIRVLVLRKSRPSVPKCCGSQGQSGTWCTLEVDHRVALVLRSISK